MNNTSLIGRLTADPELKHSQSGKAYVRFHVAVDRPGKQGEEKQTDFITVVAWNKTAEFVAKYFFKGQRIGLTGSIRTGSYTDSVEFVEKKQTERQTTSGDISIPDEEDLPF